MVKGYDNLQYQQHKIHNSVNEGEFNVDTCGEETDTCEDDSISYTCYKMS